jgi:hypothetical protein
MSDKCRWCGKDWDDHFVLAAQPRDRRVFCDKDSQERTFEPAEPASAPETDTRHDSLDGHCYEGCPCIPAAPATPQHVFLDTPFGRIEIDDRVPPGEIRMHSWDGPVLVKNIGPPYNPDIVVPPATPQLPPLTKPMRNSKHWDAGVDWPLAGERAARLEREDQLSAALSEVATLREENAMWRSEHDPCPFSIELADSQKKVDALRQWAVKAPHLPDCKFREWLCGQRGCDMFHTTPCSCGRDAAIAEERAK